MADPGSDWPLCRQGWGIKNLVLHYISILLILKVNPRKKLVNMDVHDTVMDMGDDPPEEPEDRPPPTPQQLDQLQYHVSLQEFGERLQKAASAAFPNDGKIRYTTVYVLLLCWDDEDPRLPVSTEIEDLDDMFANMYHFEVEIWKIPSEGSHKKLNRKILDFVELGDDSKDDLKIVYYGGHGMLANNRQSSWARYETLSLPMGISMAWLLCYISGLLKLTMYSRPNANDPSFRTVKWSGIQHALEDADSDVLLLLDCCASGTANTDVGHGVTELIAACGFNTSANPVGPDSFTRALLTELSLLRNCPPFTVGTLYNKLLRRLQNWMPVGREMQKPPLHVVLTQKSQLSQSIQLAPRGSFNGPIHGIGNMVGFSPISPLPNNFYHSSGTASNEDSSPSTGCSPILSTRSPSSQSSWPSEDTEVPVITITVRLKETMSASQLSDDLFADWLRMMPASAEQVKVQAGFKSFSTLLILSIPVEMWCYLDQHPAITLTGLTKSSNLVKSPNGEMDYSQILSNVSKGIEPHRIWQVKRSLPFYRC
jgi:hypothetical protein